MKIWTNVSYLEALTKSFDEAHTPHHFTSELSDAEIIFGRTDPTGTPYSSNLRWIHVDAAGYEKFDAPEIRKWLQERGIRLTNSSSVYAEPCAQHVFAMMMALARRLPDSLANQRQERGWPMWEIRAESYLLNGQTAIFLGYGAIARCLAQLLAPFEMNLIAVRRHVTGDETIKTISEEQLPEYLPQASHLLNILPANQTTTNFVNAERLALLHHGAIYYSIGRGTTTDHEALQTALRSGQVSYAYLDVTNPEPLPAEHPLWLLPNCYITPHTAGGHIGEQERLIKLFLDNLRRFTNEEALIDRII